MDNARSALASLKASEEKYDVLYVNTPWSKMDVALMGKLPLNDISADNAALFMWTDPYSAAKTSSLIEKWGFRFHSVFQVMDIAQHPWMKKPKKEDEPKKEDDIKEETDTKKKHNKKPRAPPVVVPKWWSPEPEGVTPSRPTTEQLWLAVKGDTSNVFANSTLAYNVVNVPEIGKKSRSKKASVDSEWDMDRPQSFLETVTCHLSASSRVLDVFSSTLHDKIDSWGPGLSGGYLTGFSKNHGIVGDINSVMRAMKKTQLQSLTQTIPKILASEADESVHAGMKDSWDPIVSKMESLKTPMAYNWKKDDGSVEEWAYELILLLAQKNVSDFSTLRKKRKKRQNAPNTGDRPRHGIASASTISRELAEFLEIDPEEKIARTTVVSKINEYIAKNKLQNPDNKVEVLLDEPLKRLLTPPEGFGPVTYFNLCKLVGVHFPKKTVEEKLADKAERDTLKEPVAKKAKA